MALFEIQSLDFSYPETSHKALSQLSLAVPTGDFVLLCGASGCGKSTLLRHLKTVLTPHGTRAGQVLFDGQPLEQVSKREQAEKIGFVLQHPDDQIVTDKVWHELAFGLESLGTDQQVMRLRVAEMASFFGIQSWFHMPVEKLSGGQKQLLNLASVMATNPTVLVLDEPTSQLDPIAATEFLTMLARINRELGVTIVLSEHRLEEAFPLADEVYVMERGTLVASGPPATITGQLTARRHPMLAAMPAPAQVGALLGDIEHTPITVKEGRELFSQLPFAPSPTPSSGTKETLPPLLELNEVYFRYQKDSPDVLKSLSLSVYPKEVFALVGGNGVGKTTALAVISGLQKPFRGRVRLHGKKVARNAPPFYTEGVYSLPQDVRNLFVRDTVREDLQEVLSSGRKPTSELQALFDQVINQMEIRSLLDKHPYDLSGGEQQRSAIAKVLLLEPRVLLLDEPTQGMDAFFKEKFGKMLENMTQRGTSVVLVSHDIEFCAQFATRCALLFDGAVVSEGNAKEFFAGNSFYTTAANRMARSVFPMAVTTKDVIEQCKSLQHQR